jgi:pimeloyl-ACP methyl ester carboxylesterase
MLNYKIMGDGTPLLLIHGFGISFNIWQNLRPLLESDFSLIMIELPGIGKSPLPEGDYLDASIREIEKLRVALKIERWHVLSYSSGTRVGECYLQRFPERVIRSVYLCPAQTQSCKALGLRIATRLDKWFPSIGNWVLSGSRLDFLIRLLGFNLKPGPHASGWMDEISSQPVEILKETIRSIPGGGSDPIPLPRVPCLFIWGRQDLITKSPSKASAHHRIIKANHAAPVLEAEQVAELALPFLSAF